MSSDLQVRVIHCFNKNQNCMTDTCKCLVTTRTYQMYQILIKSSIFWHITRSPLEVNRRFGGICRLTLQGQRICQTRNQVEEWRYNPEA
jgi:hypothetical protein